jgi:hypothetical protein
MHTVARAVVQNLVMGGGVVTSEYFQSCVGRQPCTVGHMLLMPDAKFAGILNAWMVTSVCISHVWPPLISELQAQQVVAVPLKLCLRGAPAGRPPALTLVSVFCV